MLNQEREIILQRVNKHKLQLVDLPFGNNAIIGFKSYGEAAVFMNMVCRVRYTEKEIDIVILKQEDGDPFWHKIESTRKSLDWTDFRKYLGGNWRPLNIEKEFKTELKSLSKPKFNDYKTLVNKFERIERLQLINKNVIMFYDGRSEVNYCQRESMVYNMKDSTYVVGIFLARAVDVKPTIEKLTPEMIRTIEEAFMYVPIPAKGDEPATVRLIWNLHEGTSKFVDAVEQTSTQELIPFALGTYMDDNMFHITFDARLVTTDILKNIYK